MRINIGDLIRMPSPSGTDEQGLYPIEQPAPFPAGADVSNGYGTGYPMEPGQAYSMPEAGGYTYPEGPDYPPAGMFGRAGQQTPVPGALRQGGRQSGIWQRDTIPPDNALPVALKRIPPASLVPWSPNKYDYQLLRDAAVWKYVASHGGLKSCCRIPELGTPIWDQPPWEVMPSQGIEYKEMNAQPTTAFQSGGAFTGADTPILDFRVPIGYDGVLSRFVAETIDVTGWDEFSGNIIWRVKVGQRYAKNLGNVTNTYGSFQNAFVIPGYSIRLISGQTVTLYANVPAGSPIAGGSIAAGAFGWFYPRR